MSYRKAAPAAALAAIMIFSAQQATSFGDSAGITAAKPVVAKTRVSVHDNYFEPRSTEVVEPALVTWKWRGENRHNIRFTKVPEGASRKGASVRTEGRWKRRFHRPGVYRYVCKVWSGMRGSVTVRAEPPEPQT
jgi:plastocyanin